MPVEPPVSEWALPDIDRLPAELQDEDLVGLGADLEPGTLLQAYRNGLFPMHVALLGERQDERQDERQGDGEDDSGSKVLGWWSPEPRGVLVLDELRISRSLRRSCRSMRTTVDEAFDAVVDGCADPTRSGRWINDDIRVAYRRLHDLGWAHSVETWQGPHLVGGLYGVCVGGLFAGESMFHRVPDASKVALVRLVDELAAGGFPRLLDVQWVTEHLASLGATPIPRQEYRRRLREALSQPLPRCWDRPPS